MGFPTANFPADSKTPQGTYFSTTKIGNKTSNSITFIGTVDTFDEKDFSAETYILDFDQDIYGQKITVNILKKLRDNKKFNSTADLIKQIEKDKKEAINYFSSSAE